jgi:hypothetical protein
MLVSSVAYPNLLGLKYFVVVVKITIYENIAIIQQAKALLFTKHLSLLFLKKIEDTFTHQKPEIIVHKFFIFCFQHTNKQ